MVAACRSAEKAAVICHHVFLYPRIKSLQPGVVNTGTCKFVVENPDRMRGVFAELSAGAGRPTLTVLTSPLALPTSAATEDLNRMRSPAIAKQLLLASCRIVRSTLPALSGGCRSDILIRGVFGQRGSV